jgi:cyclophilin family peptidyl-prolyl cis-trans isomerase
MRDLVCQSGDWISHDGTDSESIYASGVFEDENFILRHTGPGCVSMANKGPDSNGSQFYITFVETTWFNDKHVVIGYCMGEESLDVLDQIHQMSTETGKPAAPVLIADCGMLFVADTY